MSKWKCGICNREFENYHAQGFDNIIYCPLCYYKELYKRDKKEIERLNNIINELEEIINYEIEEWQNTDDELMKARVQEDKHILDVIQELKDSDNNVKKINTNNN